MRLVRFTVLPLCAVLLAGPLHAAPEQTEYLLHCSGCHGADGRGLPQNGIPDLHDAGRWAALPGGREYLVQVPGISASHLDSASAARILNWALRTFSAAQLPPDFRPFTADEVARLRSDLATDAGRRRQALMETMGGRDSRPPAEQIGAR